MNIAYHSSDAYSKVLGTSIVSVFENNKEFDEINIFVIEKCISKENKNNIREIAQKYKRNIFFIPMPDINSTENLGIIIAKKGWIYDSYCRLYLHDILPETVGRVLYLDSDVLCTGSLEELWKMDLGEKCVAGVMDCFGEAYYKNVFEMNDTGKYCNSGVLLFDLDKWKEEAVGEKIREYVHKKAGYIYFMEQTAFNHVMQDKIEILHPKYNTYTMMSAFTYKELKALRGFRRFYKEEEIKAALLAPVLCHMTSCFMVTNRAWIKNTDHPLKNEWYKYAMLTPWGEDAIFDDTRNARKKVLDAVLKICPRILLFKTVNLIAYNYRVKRIVKEYKKYEVIVDNSRDKRNAEVAV